MSAHLVALPRTAEADGPAPAAFRAAMGAFATGVTVVTMRSADGALHGTTVNSFTSVSLEPMLVLVCLNSASRGLDLIAETGVFGVSVLADRQQGASRWFADRHRPADTAMFAGFPYQLGRTGCPVLTDAVASFDCRVHQLHDAGDHVIAIGDVVELRHHGDRQPLVFHSGDYRAVA